MANETSVGEVEEVKKKAKDKLEIINPTPRELFPDEKSFATDLYLETIKNGYSKIIITPYNVLRMSCVILKNSEGKRYSVSWSQTSRYDHDLSLNIVELDEKSPKIIKFEQQPVTDKVKVKYWDYSVSKAQLPESRKKDFMNQVAKATFDFDSTALYRAREVRNASHTILKRSTVLVGSSAEFNFPGSHPLNTL